MPARTARRWICRERSPYDRVHMPGIDNWIILGIDFIRRSDEEAPAVLNIMLAEGEQSEIRRCMTQLGYAAY